jgi:hypothetical protein
MSKSETTVQPTATIATIAAVTATAAAAPPRLGDYVAVRVAEGLDLINTETGQQFAPGEATPQTVTVLTLRRLADGDLVLA